MRIQHQVLVLVAALAGGRGAADPAPPTATPEAVAMREPAAPMDPSDVRGVVEVRVAPQGVAAYRRNAWVPLLEAGVMVAGLNLVDRQVLGYEWAKTDPETAVRNLRNWQLDGDPFEMNNLMHPYTGSMYYGAARSMGLGMWWSFGVASVGSALWEIGGETEPASINDQIMTSVGGSFLGEVLYRSAVLILCGGEGAPGFWREGAALLVSPPTGANRLMFGDRYRTFDFDQQPATYLEASAGAAFDLAPGPRGGSAAPAALVGLHLIHGLPGEEGWPVRHPFDHFDLQVGLRSGARESFLSALLVRGMLAGRRIEGSWSGIWGLAGLFDYATPGAFHVSTAALGAATTGQLGARGGVALQGTAILGAGFGTGGAAFAPADGPGNHRGPAAQLVLESRLLLGSRGAIGAGLRQYLVAGSGETSGLEAQGHLTVSGRLRVGGRHAVGVEWMDARRWSRDPGVPGTGQRASELSLSYVLLTDRAFGARPRRNRPGCPGRSGPARRLARAEPSRRRGPGLAGVGSSPGLRRAMRLGASSTRGRDAVPHRLALSGVGRRVLAAALLMAGAVPAARADEPEDHWERGEARAFASGRIDLGTLQHLALAAGWGKPHWIWAGAEVHGAVGLDFAAAAADLRVALLVFDLWAGVRSTHAFQHLPLQEAPRHEGLPKGGGFSYRTLDLFASGAVPTPGGLALWEVNAVRFLDPPAGAQIYEEWLRVVCAPPWCGVARLAWAARLREGALYLGAGAEWAFEDGRAGPELVRLGPVVSWRLWPHLLFQGAIYAPVSDPDRLALLDRVNAVLVLTWTFASGDAPPRFP